MRGLVPFLVIAHILQGLIGLALICLFLGAKNLGVDEDKGVNTHGFFGSLFQTLLHLPQRVVSPSFGQQKESYAMKVASATIDDEKCISVLTGEGYCIERIPTFARWVGSLATMMKQRLPKFMMEHADLDYLFVGEAPYQCFFVGVLMLVVSIGNYSTVLAVTIKRIVQWVSRRREMGFRNGTMTISAENSEDSDTHARMQ
eukprot:gnl/Carplike_NY0171/10609_a14984_162.p1 GENE.gnl/Carplike_NY0171/10609_a14984_162~~gnl/Carplike_NY0171/10609_a14984_162.p1  ORF type:complete len:229 (-),score=50.38 gnl/Carplike_NY0171/10609_a14984_162:259-861(-)